jgi:hypothetical protein
MYAVTQGQGAYTADGAGWAEVVPMQPHLAYVSASVLFLPLLLFCWLPFLWRVLLVASDQLHITYCDASVDSW